MKPKPFQAPTTELMNGLLPAFEFVSLIMSNADQAVYLASQKSLDRHVAIKVHSPSISADEDFKDAFEVMARQMAKLNHINLIGVFNSGVVEDMLYLVMEFVPGKPLQQVLKGKSLEPAQVTEVIDGICSGLARAHYGDILHGGLSPLNVLVTADYVPKIGNFGFVSTASSDGEDVSSRYIAPELEEETGSLSPLADVYSLGVLLYELYTGKPFVIGTVPPELSTIPGRKILEVIKKATARDPKLRYASVEEFQAECVKTLPQSKAVAASKLKVAAKSPKSPRSPKSRVSTASAKSSAVGAAMESPKGGHQMRMLIHLLLILILSYAIYIVWNRLEHKKSEAAKEEKKQQLEELQQKKMREAERIAARLAQQKRLEELQKKIDQNKPPEPEAPPETPVVQVRPKTSYESLDKLRQKLAAGDRSKMPDGVVKNGESYYLLIDRAMSWPEAFWFAEGCGAHLAFPSAETSSQWLQSQLGVHAVDAMWIGVAKGGQDLWVFADGSIWQPNGPPPSGGDFLALGKDGKLQAGNAEEQRPFVIQWSADGSNPGALANLLQRTQVSISQKRPIYPPGTLTFGIRHYLYVARPMDWESAAALAETGGGHLLVVGGAAEAFNIDKMVGGLPARDGIWLGGRCKSGKWSWVTNEQWEPTKWSGPDAPKLQEAALVMRPSMGWKERDPRQKASGFIIEWSLDGSNAVR